MVLQVETAGACRCARPGCAAINRERQLSARFELFELRCEVAQLCEELGAFD